MPRIESVLRANLCAGCGLCVGLALDSKVTMSIDAAGYLRPNGIESISNTISESAYEVCPGVNGMHVGNTDFNMTKDPLWGEYDSICVGYSTNQDVRFQGSSGGVLTEVGRFLLESGRVSAVVAAASRRDDPLRVEAKIVTSAEELLNLAGSKYSPSAPLTLIQEMRNFRGKIAFIGKPCDVAGLRMACNKDDQLRENIAFFLSFFCAGVPSEKGNETIIRKLGVPRAELVDFWHRGRGWPGKTTAVSKNGRRGEMSYREAWGGTLSKQLQFRCKICADGVGEAADIVAGDAWECDSAGYPLFGESEGRSLIITRTNVGSELLTSLQENERLEFFQIDAREIDQMQPGQLRRRRALSSRIQALKLLGMLTPAYPKGVITQFSKGMRFKERLKETLGTIWRVYKSKNA